MTFRPVVRNAFRLCLLLGLAALFLTSRSPPSGAQAPGEQSRDWVQTSVLDWSTGQRSGLLIADESGGELRLSEATVTGVYTSAVVLAAFPFNAIVPHWRANVPLGTDLRVELRVQASEGPWSSWFSFDEAEWEADVGAFYPEAPLLLWDGTRFQYRLRMDPSPEGASPVLDALTITYIDTSNGPTAAEAKASATRFVGQAIEGPAVISRAGWGADESYRYDSYGRVIWPVEYWPVQKLVVHHTVTSNDYTEDQAAASVRAIYRYHALTRGWGDIGYNYLVDQYGNVYEGRYGGPGVVGGHVYGYNRGTMGMGVIGTHGNVGNSVPPTEASLNALVDLCTYEASRSYIYPFGNTSLWGATPPNLAGHRDYPPSSTSCPGDYLAAQLPQLRQRVWERLTDEISAYDVNWQSWGKLPPAVIAGGTYTLNLRARNTGWLTWVNAGTANHMRLGYHWLDSEGQPVVQPPVDDHRTPLNNEVPWGATYEFATALVTTPVTPGTYTLAWDMVHEGVTWFHDANVNSQLLTMFVANVAPMSLTGNLADLLGRPVATGSISALGWEKAGVDADGTYILVLPAHGTYTLTASAPGYASAPAARGVDASAGDQRYDFWLAPSDFSDDVINGDFEAGLGGWSIAGTSQLPTWTAKAHTGLGAAQLGGDAATGTAWIAQTVTLPDVPPAPALSLLYQASAGTEGAVLQVTISRQGLTQRAFLDEPTLSVAHTLPVTASGWTHFHTSLPDDWGGALDLRIELTQGSGSPPTTVQIDEVRLGHSPFKLYIPAIATLQGRQ